MLTGSGGSRRRPSFCHLKGQITAFTSLYQPRVVLCRDCWKCHWKLFQFCNSKQTSNVWDLAFHKEIDRNLGSLNKAPFRLMQDPFIYGVPTDALLLPFLSRKLGFGYQHVETKSLKLQIHLAWEPETSLHQKIPLASFKTSPPPKKPLYYWASWVFVKAKADVLEKVTINIFWHINSAVFPQT